MQNLKKSLAFRTFVQVLKLFREVLLTPYWGLIDRTTGAYPKQFSQLNLAYLCVIYIYIYIYIYI